MRVTGAAHELKGRESAFISSRLIASLSEASSQEEIVVESILCHEEGVSIEVQVAAVQASRRRTFFTVGPPLPRRPALVPLIEIMTVEFESSAKMCPRSRSAFGSQPIGMV